MNAIHINWTRPYFARGASEYEAEDFELLTTILSALKWRENNGSIKMVTDRAGADYYRSNGLDCLWDGGIDESLEDICQNEGMFWAAGKLYALALQKTPVAVIDTDFIVWGEILFDKLPALAVIHDEELYADVYPEPGHFQMEKDYRFDPDWNWHIKAYNTAFYVIKDEELRRYYTSEAIRFMDNSKPCGDSLTYMVFAEQRLLAMCAEKLKKETLVFSKLEKLFRNGDGFFTHTWGMKQQMRDNTELREAFCRKCIDRISRDFPYMRQIMSNIDILKKYF